MLGALRLKFGSRRCDLILVTEIWASSLEFGFWGGNLGFEVRIWGQVTGKWTSGLEFGL